jgi:very-short-patch-repair endonuclease
MASNLEELFAFQLRALGIQAVREHRFAPPRRWRFDFALPELLIAVEIEGGVWTGGRHTRGSGFTADAEKYAEALCLGWRVLRITGDHVRSGQGLKWLERLMALVRL